MTAFARKVLNELAAPNITAGKTETNFANNYSELVTNRNFNDKFNVKLDHHFSERLSGFVPRQPSQGERVQWPDDSRSFR
jgi:hypothetical protein